LRRESRERVFQTLFLMDSLHVGPDAAAARFRAAVFNPGATDEDDERLTLPPDPEYYDSTLAGAWEKREEIDALISRAAENWRIERMTGVDRSILRLGAYEIAFAAGVPFAVAIHEAVELAKRYGSEDSGAFVNGILDRIAEITGKKEGKR
jgi:N utilization substance protein B